MISVYITSFNKQNYLSQAIQSVLDQSLQPHEIIIIDDASSDSSKDIITGFKSRYPDIIKTIFNERNHGISKTRNVAISHCSGDIITFVDADDYYFPRKIEIEMKKLKDGNYGCVYSNHVFIDEFGHENGLFSNDGDQPAEGNIFKENFSRSFRVSSGANFHNEMLYKSCAQDIGLYDDKIMIWEDWDFRIRMSKKYHFGYCPEVNSAYRKLVSGLHNSGTELHYHEQIKIYNKNKPLIQDLKEEEKSHIHNRVYSKIKVLFIQVMEKNIHSKYFFRTIYYCIHFILTFKTRKSISVALRVLNKG